jgi:phosphate acetyltransferase
MEADGVGRADFSKPRLASSSFHAPERRKLRHSRWPSDHNRAPLARISVFAQDRGMTRNAYIASTEPRSGKSLIALGVMELVSRRLEDLGFFRPVIRADGRDNDIELIRHRYCPTLRYESLYGVTYDEAARLTEGGRADELLQRIFERFKQLESNCQFVLCEGTDYTDVAAAFEFDFNSELANHLGCDLLLVVNGRLKDAEQILRSLRAARAACRSHDCSVAATVVNRTALASVDEVAARWRSDWPYEDPVFVLREQALLSSPTVQEIAQALGARPIYQASEGQDREVLHYKVAAMQLSNFLGYVEENSLIITPGDRADVILACLGSLSSDNYPNIAGILLTGGLEPDPAICRLLDGLRRPGVPIYLVPSDTYTTAMEVQQVAGVIRPDNQRKIATALGTFEAAVPESEFVPRITGARSSRVTPLMFEYELVQRARADRQHIVLPEGTEDRIVRAADILLRRGVVDITLLGTETEMRERITSLGLELPGVRLVDPARSPHHDDYAQAYFELRRHKGITQEYAQDVMHDVSYFGTMMVRQGDADGMVSGAVHTTADTIRPALQIIRTTPGCSIVSSVLFMCLQDRVLVYGDCAINPQPTAEQLADIAVSSAETALLFGISPRVALLSYSTGESGHGADVDKVRAATRLAQQRHPELPIEGPIQYDAAVDARVARTKMPGSEVAGRATVLVFPDLNTGNNTYKAVQRSAGAIVIGPVLQGLRKAVNDLSRGCTVPDIVNTIAITAIQAQNLRGAAAPSRHRDKGR